MTTEGAEALYNADQLKAGENLPPFGSSRVVDFCWLDFFLAERGGVFFVGGLVPDTVGGRKKSKGQPPDKYEICRKYIMGMNG